MCNNRVSEAGKLNTFLMNQVSKSATGRRLYPEPAVKTPKAKVVPTKPDFEPFKLVIDISEPGQAEIIYAAMNLIARQVDSRLVTPIRQALEGRVDFQKISEYTRNG